MPFLSATARCAAAALLLACSLVARPSETPDQSLLAAHQAWSTRDLATLTRHAQQLADDPLADYVQYWLLDLRLGQPGPVPNADIQAFFTRFPYSPLADPLRVSWLKALARSDDWTTFAAQVTPRALEDPEVACDHLQERMRHQDVSVVHDARILWFSPKSQPDSCDPVFRLLAAENLITRDDVWLTLRRALGSNNLPLARYINSFLPPLQGLSEDALTQAYTQPGTFLDTWDAAGDTRPARELALFALSQLAARDPQQAADIWLRLSPRFSSPERAYGWLQVAWQGAMAQHPNALAWFGLAGELTDDRMRAWRTRAALSQGNWDEVLRTINGMSPGEAARSAWRYWKGRALQALGRSAEAQAQWKPLSQESNYYGLLALEELGGQLTLPPEPAPLMPDEIDALRPHLARALRLHGLGLVPESQFEWNAVNRPLSPRQRLVLSALASQVQWYDRAIYSIERAGDQQDLALRFPLAFEETVRQQARQNHLDEAWVFGLVRQESYFAPLARSRTGAMGLMQLMPATARWVAKRIPLHHFQWAKSTQVDTNLQLGTFYLRHLLNRLGHPILATAGYNAGPNRVLRWVSGNPQEAAVFIESIPVSETRGYVEHVMFNATVYALRLGQSPQSLHQRLGTIPGMKPAHNGEPDPAAAP
ncbi:MAG: lytic transglycosylase domain-containing protein [Betaproteobacteria bacterium]|nr:lytic transglycosylase domain-containing protein [Betaproteobacteria bacterium]